MARATHEEVEIKLPQASAHEARALLERLGATLVEERTFEDNAVLDREPPALAGAGTLLRIRRAGGRCWLTLKAPVAGVRRHKVREEHETPVADAEALSRILHHLGFEPVYRYQKYRSRYALGALEISLDETPIGCFIELEGRGEEIDRIAAALGFRPEQYVLASYLDLHDQHARAQGRTRGDMVFDR